jgi:hypothetical protein
MAISSGTPGSCFGPVAPHSGQAMTLKFRITPEQIARPEWDAYRRDLMQRAQGDDPKAGAEIADIVAAHMDAQKPLPDDLRDYVMRNLRRVLHDQD